MHLFSGTSSSTLVLPRPLRSDSAAEPEPIRTAFMTHLALNLNLLDPFEKNLMCRSKMAVDAAEPSPNARSSRPAARRSTKPPVVSESSTGKVPSSSYSTGSGYILDSSTTTNSVSSWTSLPSLRRALPENPHIYDFAEIRSATNSFLAKRYSSSSTPSWRCILRDKDVVVFQRKSRRSIELSQLRERLSVICRSHHVSIIKLLGVSISGDNIFFVYDFVNGASVSDLLRNPKNPNFTVLSTWMSRMQIATDFAHGLDYIHNNTGLNIGLVHKHIKSSALIITEPSFNARICHFGAAELCGETAIENKENRGLEKSQFGEIEEPVPESPAETSRSDAGVAKFEGVRGYMSPEFRATGIATQKSDVYAFGVVILELLSGGEPIKYKFERTSGQYQKISVVETARHAVEGGAEEVEGRVRRWVDRRLGDSFPVELAEKVIKVALECVHVDPEERPSMGRVAGKISKLFLQSRTWSDQVRVPTEISVSWTPR
ncbi:lysM domain receptor-like kinase 3 [Diospyros lotus]|uniref:lysM domain receptor-like kinase 3 n=1 Tax=Diospyros lotus TaxID=55363 RepID=UPI002257B29D|nr:lysM domain receptor-like kinase 3 [Diospyros lotus]